MNITREPLAIRAAILAVLAGVTNVIVVRVWDLTPEEIAQINTAVAGLATLLMVLWVRPSVTPVNDPHIEGEGEYAPPELDENGEVL
jgi:hypothetical protein